MALAGILSFSDKIIDKKLAKAEILEQRLQIAVESPDVDAFEAKITEHAENF